jgi:glutamyl-tRNA synthetase
MALLGWSGKDDQEIFTLTELKERFDFSGVNNSNSKFDYTKCCWVNGEHLKLLPADELLAQATPFLQTAGIPVDDSRVAAALELARERAQLLSEIPGVIATIFADEVEYDEESVEKVTSRDGMKEVVTALTEGLKSVENWIDADIKSGIANAAETNGAKMGALMFPCRVATMGSTSGADLVPVLQLLGKEETLKRLDSFGSKYL